MAATAYKVFTYTENDAWALTGKDTVEAVSADAAVRAVALARGAGTYVAVPARSWQPRTVKVEARASFEDTP